MFLSRGQLREIDRRSIVDYHIPGVVLMENAARAAADAACEMLGDSHHADVLILCGGGNNGGDGLAIARHLHNRGANVSIALAADPARYAGDALTNWRIIEAMRLSTQPLTPQLIQRARTTLIIDAIFGTGLSRPPREPFAEVAHEVNERGVPVLAVDIPSGLDCDTGEPLGACIAAARTITFVARKTGFANPRARPYLGEITIGDIGCPSELTKEIAAQGEDPNPHKNSNAGPG